MKKISSICFLFVTMLLAACDGSVKPSQTKLTLSADKLTIMADGEDKAVFTVRDQSNQDYSQKAIYKVNGKKIDKAEFSTKIPGEYKVVAMVGEIISNEITINAREEKAEVKAIILKVDKTIVLVDGIDKMALSCYDADNQGGEPLKEVTYFANGEKLEGAAFQPKEAGTFKLKAQYGELFSPEIEVTATKGEPEDFKPTPHVLLEDWTGTWCQYCPRAHAILEEADKDPMFVTLEIHSGGSDPFAVDQLTSPLYSAQNINGFPTIRANRMYSLTLNFEIIKKTFADFTTQVGIALDVRLENGKVVAKTKVRRQPTFTSEVRLCIALYENNLHADQVNSVFPDKGNPIRNQRFDHVLRDFYNKSPLGFGVEFEGDIHAGQYVFTPEGNWKQQDLGVIVMALDKKGRVLNAQYANIGDSKGY